MFGLIGEGEAGVDVLGDFADGQHVWGEIRSLENRNNV